MTTLHAPRSTLHAPRSNGRAFTLIEILVTVGLLSFIVLGLLAMFNQTQRAFRVSMTQAQVLEAGRNVADMLARELEQTTPSNRTNELNFLYGVWPGFSRQGLPGSVQLRTNYVGYFFFLSGENQKWSGTGYYVDDVMSGGNGTLFRFATNRFASSPISMSTAFLNAVSAARGNPQTTTNGSWNRIADGVVHLQVRTFAPNGFPIVGYDLVPSPPPALNATNACYRTNAFTDVYAAVQRATATRSLAYPDDLRVCYFWSNAVPAFVEVELGILEPQILERYKSIGSANQAAQLNYFSNHVAQVHLFRQRIPIRNVDLSAYP